MIVGKDITDRIRNGLPPEEAIRRLEKAIPYEPGHVAEEGKSYSVSAPPSAAPPVPQDTGALGRAMKFLRAKLITGPRPAREIQRVAAEAGISQATLRRARERLRIISSKEGRPGEKGRWIWEMRQGEWMDE